MDIGYALKLPNFWRGHAGEGAFHENKFAKRLLRCFQKILNAPYNFIVFGDRELGNLIKSHKKNNIHFIGHYYYKYDTCKENLKHENLCAKGNHRTSTSSTSCQHLENNIHIIPVDASICKTI